MSGLETDIQWYIAREGKQHGPVSDLELSKLVEFGHLKADDLVWKQGFTDWRTASSVFPNIGAAPPPPTAAPAAQQPNAPSSAPPTATNATTTQPAAAAPQGSSRAEPASSSPLQPAAASPTLSAASPQNLGTGGTAPGPGKADTWRPPAEPRVDPALATRPLGTPTARTAGPFPAGGPGAPSTQGPRPGTDTAKPSEIAVPPREQPPARSGGRRKALVAVGLLAMTGVGAWIASQYKDEILAQIASTGSSTSDTGTVAASLAQRSPDDASPAAEAANPPTAETPPPAEVAAAPEPAALTAPAGPTPEDIDRKLQGRTMWVTVKQQFPEWYQARVVEVARLEGEQRQEAEISRYLIDELVTLRRQNAQHALAASTARHKELASAFLANLKQLAQESGDGCYDFISKGESSAAVVARLGDPAKSTEIEAQIVAIVGAIVEGRSQPATHATPIRTDYDVLAGELGRLGWTQADMQLFADPKALAQAPRARVCSMLQDWFTAHLAIQDPSTQARLLFETLKPVISG